MFLQVTPPISLFHSLSLSLSHTHTHTNVPSSRGVRSGDKATRSRGRRTTALTVLARGETESENGVFLPPGHSSHFTISLPLSLSLSLSHTHTHTHTDVPSSGGVRSGDKATRGRGGGRGRRTTALTVLARGETESENGVFLQVTPPISLFHSLSLSLSLSHTHTQMSHHQVVFVLETRQPEVAVGEPLLLQFQQEGRLRVRMVCSSLQVTPPISLFYSLPFSHAHEHACMCAHTRTQTHTHTQMSHRQVCLFWRQGNQRSRWRSR